MTLFIVLYTVRQTFALDILDLIGICDPFYSIIYSIWQTFALDILDRIGICDPFFGLKTFPGPQMNRQKQCSKTFGFREKIHKKIVSVTVGNLLFRSSLFRSKLLILKSDCERFAVITL